MKKKVFAIIAAVMALIVSVAALAEDGAEIDAVNPEETATCVELEVAEPVVMEEAEPIVMEEAEAVVLEIAEPEVTEATENTVTETDEPKVTEEIAEDTAEETAEDAAEEIADENPETEADEEAEEESVFATAYAPVRANHTGEAVAEGTVIVLTADVSAYEGMEYSIVWQYTADNGVTVHNATSTDATQTFIANAETVTYLWRAVITYRVPVAEVAEAEATL